MAKRRLYYITEFPCTNEVAIKCAKNQCFIPQTSKVCIDLCEFKLYLSDTTNIIYKNLDYEQIATIKNIICKYVYCECNC